MPLARSEETGHIDVDDVETIGGFVRSRLGGVLGVADQIEAEQGVIEPLTGRLISRLLEMNHLFSRCVYVPP